MRLQAMRRLKTNSDLSDSLGVGPFAAPERVKMLDAKRFQRCEVSRFIRRFPFAHSGGREN